MQRAPGEKRQWQALPSPVQCEETATRTQNLPVTSGKTLSLAPGTPFTSTINIKTKMNFSGSSITQYQYLEKLTQKWEKKRSDNQLTSDNQQTSWVNAFQDLPH